MKFQIKIKLSSMNGKRFYIVFLALITSGIINAQANLLNSTSVDQIGKKTKEQLLAVSVIVFAWKKAKTE